MLPSHAEAPKASPAGDEDDEIVGERFGLDPKRISRESTRGFRLLFFDFQTTNSYINLEQAVLHFKQLVSPAPRNLLAERRTHERVFLPIWEMLQMQGRLAPKVRHLPNSPPR